MLCTKWEVSTGEVCKPCPDIRRQRFELGHAPDFIKNKRGNGTAITSFVFYLLIVVTMNSTLLPPTDLIFHFCLPQMQLPFRSAT